MCALTCGAFAAAGLRAKMIPNPLRAFRRFAWAGRLTISWSIRRKESRVWGGVGEEEYAGSAEDLWPDFKPLDAGQK